MIVEPGIIKTTRWSRHRGTAAGANDPDSPYHGLFWASEAIADKLVERSPTRPRGRRRDDREGADAIPARGCATSSGAARRS